MKTSRNITMDYLKSFSVVVMLSAHSLQYLGNIDAPKSNLLFMFFREIGFPIFMFVFGYLCYGQQLVKENYNSKKIFKRSIMLLLFYYVNAIVVFGGAYFENISWKHSKNVRQ